MRGEYSVAVGRDSRQRDMTQRQAAMRLRARRDIRVATEPCRVNVIKKNKKQRKIKRGDCAVDKLDGHTWICCKMLVETSLSSAMPSSATGSPTRPVAAFCEANILRENESEALIIVGKYCNLVIEILAGNTKINRRIFDRL